MIAIESVMQALPWLLAISVLLASLRLLLALRHLPADARPRASRTALLLLGQCASMALLFLLLRTTDPGDNIHTLHLLTAHAPDAETPMPRAGELWLRMPEAASRKSIDTTPDLATVLRQHPQAHTLHIIGDGLETRDRDAASGIEIRFEPAPLATGIRDWWAPQSVQSGDAVHVRGSAQGGARIELLDPSGTRADQQALQGDGVFSLQSPARSSGLAMYQLRLRDADNKTIATTIVPVQVLPTLPTHLLLRSGGPDPELKFLRRWATDNGATLQATIDLGAGMQAGDPSFALDTRTLADTDVLILDDRSWNGLGHARRTNVLDAVSNGMGLLLRSSAPLADGDALGLQVQAASLPTSFKLPVVDANDSTLPALTRPQLRIDNPSGQTVLRDDRGNPLVAWRAHGRGRIGVWLPTDSYRLALAGRADLHARLWADAINAVTRPRAAAPRDMPGLVYAGERTQFCRLGDAARILQPGDATPLRLVIDPRSGDKHCAAFWPRRAGWHQLVDGTSDTAFLVRAQGADQVLRAARTQQATAVLADHAPTLVKPAVAAPTLPRWALFLLWLAVTSALWWFERSRLGRVRTTTPG
ncbi:hypothetical protein [Thermomonas sp.]|uniref:hypothetical protein n=1 Tax=Thermomonas sp. TaxID=1971895 RepID=UPI00248A3D9C|nr:hypothetical protein [Thermomonas sp.]MDI1253209.1 hypothetical protein [Thermomonas sp.]